MYLVNAFRFFTLLFKKFNIECFCSCFGDFLIPLIIQGSWISLILIVCFFQWKAFIVWIWKSCYTFLILVVWIRKINFSNLLVLCRSSWSCYLFVSVIYLFWKVSFICFCLCFEAFIVTNIGKWPEKYFW